MTFKTLASLSCGAKFFRADLHIHSFGASHDVKDTKATPAAIVDTAQREGLAIISLTDHNEIANVPAAVEAGRNVGVLVIPGVELSTPEGHLLCYLPTADALERFFNRLQIAERRTPNCRCQTGALQCLELVAAEGGFGVLAHVELAGAFEANMPRFTPAKLDILCHSALEGVEVTRADCPVFYDRSDADHDRKNAAVERIRRLNLGSEQYLARILNSDAHSLNAVGRNANRDQRITRYKMEEPTFDGLSLSCAASIQMEQKGCAAPFNIRANRLWIRLHDLRRTLAGSVFGSVENLGTVAIALGHSSGKEVTENDVPHERGRTLPWGEPSQHCLRRRLLPRTSECRCGGAQSKHLDGCGRTHKTSPRAGNRAFLCPSRLTVEANPISQPMQRFFR